MKYAFIQEHRTQFRLTSMCRVLKVHRSGYYAWLHEPLSPRAKENEALTLKIREFYDHSMGIYGSPRIFCRKLPQRVNKLKIETSISLEMRDEEVEIYGKPNCWDIGRG